MQIKFKKLFTFGLAVMLSLSYINTFVYAEETREDMQEQTGQGEKIVQPYANHTGDFVVTGGTYGIDYTYDGNLNILTSTKLTITTNKKASTSMIRGMIRGITYNLVFQNLYMNGTQNDSHIYLLGHCNLTILGTNKIDVTGIGFKSGSLTITANSTGKLDIKGTDYAASLWVNGLGSTNANVEVNGGSLTYNTAEITGTMSTSGTGTINGNTYPKSPMPTFTTSQTASTITINPTNYQSVYGDVQYKLDDGQWQSNNVFTMLQDDTSYKISVKYVGSNDFVASDVATTHVLTRKNGSDLISHPISLTALYGQALSDVSLPNGWTWEDDSTKLSVGEQVYPVIFDTTNYEEEYDFTSVIGYDADEKKVKRSFMVDVSKANSIITITASDMDKEYNGKSVDVPTVEKTGSTKDITHTWYQEQVDGSWKSISNAPIHAGSYKVVTSVEDDDNYYGASAELSFTITKAVPKFNIPEDLSIKEGEQLSAIILPNGFSWKDETQTADTHGKQTFTAIFTPTDMLNYQIVEVAITVDVEPIPIPVNYESMDPTVDNNNVKTSDKTNLGLTIALFAISGMILVICANAKKERIRKSLNIL